MTVRVHAVYQVPGSAHPRDASDDCARPRLQSSVAGAGQQQRLRMACGQQYPVCWWLGG
eukprot:NODE_32416_length_369_cov_2.987603.p3 GENE.NODE_32416_length_369_cov_2.987603~~NODE_32416_length_369_cov_2.987603.p3  ORF type:complete len:59 (+),score=8.35 NODE_32416_length_369_cov_2.987603:160-336(+)